MQRRLTTWLGVPGLVLVLAACTGGSGASAPPAASQPAASQPAASEPAASEPAESQGTSGGPELVVWADNSANTAKAIEPLCQAWAEENGVTCTVRKFNGGGEINEALTAGNASGDVPDVFEGPHDWIGEFVKNGILAPIDLGSNRANLSEPAVAGVTWDGSTYAVPWAVENVAMLTNKSLSPTCPATLDEAVENAKALIADGKATEGFGLTFQIGATGDAYHWYPLFTADGGYAFAQNPDGTYDMDDMGVGKEGSIAAAERLSELADEDIVNASITYDIARETFASGKSPYFITGPWQVPEQTEALGDDLMVCPVPNWDGSEYVSTPFLGVRAFMQPAKAKNPTLASTFLADEVMTTEFMDGMFSVDPRPPAWLESLEKASSDPIVAAFGAYGQQGIPMPSGPEMTAFFEDLGLAEAKIASGEDPETTIVEAGESINKRNEALQ
jgi:maltose-binding protein MalE